MIIYAPNCRSGDTPFRISLSYKVYQAFHRNLQKEEICSIGIEIIRNRSGKNSMDLFRGIIDMLL